MTPLPKKKQTRARSASRKSVQKANFSALFKCPNCGNLKMPHRACPSCGHYK